MNASKIRIVPIAINASLFDPEATRPLPLPMGDLVFGRPSRFPAPEHQQPATLTAGGKNQDSSGNHAGSLNAEPGGRRRRPFVFLSTFKWEKRKGWDLLLSAYLKVGCKRVGSGLDRMDTGFCAQH